MGPAVAARQQPTQGRCSNDHRVDGGQEGGKFWLGSLLPADRLEEVETLLAVGDPTVHGHRGVPDDVHAPPRETLLRRLPGRPRRRGAAAVLGHLVQVARLAIDHPAAAVDGYLAAFLEHLADLLATALHPGFHSRQRGAEHLARLLLREPLELGQSNRFTVWRREPRDEQGDALAELELQIRGLVRVAAGGVYEVGAVGNGIARLGPGPVGDGSRGDAVDPAAEALVVAQGREAFVNAHEDLLHEVVDLDGGSDEIGRASWRERPTK